MLNDGINFLELKMKLSIWYHPKNSTKQKLFWWCTINQNFGVPIIFLWQLDQKMEHWSIGHTLVWDLKLWYWRSGARRLA